MENENKEKGLSFAVDLSEQEYMRFYRAITKYTTAGPLSKIGFFLVIILLAFPLVTLYQRGGMRAMFTLDGLSLFVPALLLLAYNHIILPLIKNKQAKRGYAAAKAGGQVFAGTVTITEDSITKTTPSGTLTMYFSERILFHEQKDMQMFVNSKGRGIVLPASCMTAENAEAVRNIAFRALSPAFCRVKEKMLPLRTEPMELVEEQPVVPEFETDIMYNQEDRQFVSKEISFRHFKKGFLSNCLISFFVALIFGFGEEIWVVGLLFFGMLALLTMFLGFSTRRRAKLLLSDDNFRFTFKIAKKAVIVDGGERRGVYSIPWNEVKHVYESEKHLEFYSKYHYICIPKRLITDIDSFGRLVDTCRK